MIACYNYTQCPEGNDTECRRRGGKQSQDPGGQSGISQAGRCTNNKEAPSSEVLSGKLVAPLIIIMSFVLQTDSRIGILDTEKTRLYYFNLTAADATI